MLRALSALVLAGYLLVPGTVTCQAQQKPTWLDGWREATVALGQVKRIKVVRSGNEIEVDAFDTVGTGVIFGFEQKPLCLVTAKHIFFDPSQRPSWNPEKLRLRFSWFEDRPIDQYLRKDVDSAGAALRKDDVVYAELRNSPFNIADPKQAALALPRSAVRDLCGNGCG